MMRAGVVGIIVASSIAAWAQAPVPAGAPTSAPVAAPQVAAPRCQPICRRRQVAWHGKERQHSSARRHPYRAKFPYRQALLHHHRHHRRVANEYSPERPLRHPHPVRGLRARIAGSGPQRHQSRPTRELRAHSGLAPGRTRPASNRRSRERAKGPAPARPVRACGKWPATLLKT